ncbi:small RNA 2'-O-methyltransferase-like [Apostichopus japonicus]|uniref:small RNA 2'-O-methyltransferase-like n=1 Tax=Stichopus japonicus TaxID=307972 RepID=UPI003AB2C34C
MASACETDFGEDPASSNIIFSPPVSEQRYQMAVNLTKEFKPKKVTDMGCGPCSMISRLKWHHCIQELIGVDVDADILRSHARLGEPVMGDYLQPRENPFTVRLYQGSISKVDERLKHSDLLICIEVIEHLYEDDLSKVPAVVFGGLRPERALFTTPNSDFNVLFNNKTDRFRHPDHKFEWSRRQFEDWCGMICARYPYRVEYLGAGAGPAGTEEEYGCCTQAAVFTLEERDRSSKEDERNDDDEGSILKQEETHPYTLISEITHPFKEKQDAPLERRIEWEVESCVRDILASQPDDVESHDDSEGRVYHVPLEMLLRYSALQKLCSSDTDLLRRSVLASGKLNMSDDESCLLYREGDDSEIEESSLSSDEDNYGQERLPEEEEDWDVG